MFCDETPNSEERRLMREGKGDIGPQQKLRELLPGGEYLTTEMTAQYNLLNTEQKLRELVQRKEYLTREMQKLFTKIGKKESLRKRYWRIYLVIILSLKKRGADGGMNSPLLSLEDLTCGDHIRDGIFIVYFGKTAR
ncbi:uncharacterized protein N7483_010089 [Penicillium malachiteum]|uniref:uncharacterized protein n=1 Tax=Penicillium malachiteum TaxID=1324776 RepID=UPI002549A5D9|nr:uncharacterized protein N7483_010089 [Penicillium malachiteum]KAJ5712908.1 hypothetical protein N7483_010089 [Penicillium malachiteum]